MIDLNTLKHAATFAKNDQGKPVVQIPVDIWDALLEQIEANKQPADPSQPERWQAFLRDTADYVDDKSAAWWDEFDTFLKETRPNFPERDLKLDDE
ncbi:MAG: hypothetical protein IT324_10545 [Anaerolineae bacterium]|nr:hypothetical protein [Anaerolineae bacterium]